MATRNPREKPEPNMRRVNYRGPLEYSGPKKLTQQEKSEQELRRRRLETARRRNKRLKQPSNYNLQRPRMYPGLGLALMMQMRGGGFNLKK